jgi:hypothetical protein
MNAARGKTMSEENTTEPQDASRAAPQQGRIDPAFFTCVNEQLELANAQANRGYGLRRISLAALHSAARFNAHAFLDEMQDKVPAQRTMFLDHMTQLYRRLLNDQLDVLGAARGIDVGESELAEEYKANGYEPGKGFTGAGTE